VLTKPDRRKVDLPVEVVGFEIADCFAIGYGSNHRKRLSQPPNVAHSPELIRFVCKPRSDACHDAGTPWYACTPWT